MSSVEAEDGAPVDVLPLAPVYHWYVLPAPVIVARCPLCPTATFTLPGEGSEEGIGQIETVAA